MSVERFAQTSVGPIILVFDIHREDDAAETRVVVHNAFPSGEWRDSPVEAYEPGSAEGVARDLSRLLIEVGVPADEATPLAARVLAEWRERFPASRQKHEEAFTAAAATVRFVMFKEEEFDTDANDALGPTYIATPLEIVEDRGWMHRKDAQALATELGYTFDEA